MLRKIFLVVLVFLSFNALADSKTEKVEVLMRTLGTLDLWKNQLEMARAQNQKMGRDMIEQLMAQLNPTDEYRAKFEQAFNGYLAKVVTPWTAEEIVKVWADYYGSGFTEDELDQLISFYSSPLGQKDIDVSRDATIKFSKHFQDIGEPIQKKATSEFIEELKIIAKQCNCRK